GRLQGRGRRIAGLLELDDAHLRRQSEQRMHREARGLRLIRARFRGEEQRPDALGAAALDDGSCGRRGHGDDVLIGGREAELVLADVEMVLYRVGGAGRGVVVESVYLVGRGQVDVVDADRPHAVWRVRVWTLAGSPSPLRSFSMWVAMGFPGFVC